MLYSLRKCIGLSFLIAVFTSCGYRMDNCESPLSTYSTISVPYVEGDVYGSFTPILIQEIARTSTLTYRSTGGALQLNVAIVDVRQENIGFNYDRKKKGKRTDDTIPTEERIFATAEISVTEAGSCRTLLGPVRITASVDYDHDYYFSRNGVNIFSLGQLIDIDSAYDAVQTPLHNLLAKKIVDYLNQSW